MNRYYQSNLVYGLSKGLKLNWLLALDEGLPKADLVVVIDIRTNTLVKRCRNNITDTFEQDLDLIRRVRKNYKMLAKKFNWQIINGEDSVNTVNVQVLELVRNIMKI